jgi:hypothetical protein
MDQKVAMKKEIKCAAAGDNSNGDPDICYGRFLLTEEQIESGEHYELMSELANKEGYEPVFLCDENDPAGGIMQVCEWMMHPLMDENLKPVQG